MTSRQPLSVLVATDGSAQAGAAVATVLHFPWPDGIHVSGITARIVPVEVRRSSVLAALDQTAEAIADDARRKLASRWPEAHVTVADAPPVPAILRQAERERADVIVLGWRGYGALGALLMGSVSRGVIRRAPSAVLLVKRHRKEIRRLVIGLNDSTGARRAVAFVSRLAPPAGGGQITLVTAVEPARVPMHSLVPKTVRASVTAEIERINARRASAATRRLTRAARILTRAGWDVHTSIEAGPPLHELLQAIKAANADLLVLGASGSSGLQRLLLGSVAEGAVNRCPVPVLVVR